MESHQRSPRTGKANTPLREAYNLNKLSALAKRLRVSERKSRRGARLFPRLGLHPFRDLAREIRTFTRALQSHAKLLTGKSFDTARTTRGAYKSARSGVVVLRFANSRALCGRVLLCGFEAGEARRIKMYLACPGLGEAQINPANMRLSPEYHTRALNARL